MLRLRIDVDYAYPSRTKSAISMIFGYNFKKDYLRNCKIIARIINSSKHETKVYWFFTFKTLPDKELIELLNCDKHEFGLHVVNNSQKELALLKETVKKEITYYSIHGTESLIGQILWKRKIGQKQVVISKDFPLKSIHDVDTRSLDFGLCEPQYLLSLHPDWLFKRSKSGRGPVYPLLLKLIGVKN